VFANWKPSARVQALTVNQVRALYTLPSPALKSRRSVT
jgi:hypothetical protein